MRRKKNIGEKMLICEKDFSKKTEEETYIFLTYIKVNACFYF